MKKKIMLLILVLIFSFNVFAVEITAGLLLFLPEASLKINPTNNSYIEAQYAFYKHYDGPRTNTSNDLYSFGIGYTSGNLAAKSDAGIYIMCIRGKTQSYNPYDGISINFGLEEKLYLYFDRNNESGFGMWLGAIIPVATYSKNFLTDEDTFSFPYLVKYFGNDSIPLPLLLPKLGISFRF